MVLIFGLMEEGMLFVHRESKVSFLTQTTDLIRHRLDRNNITTYSRRHLILSLPPARTEYSRVDGLPEELSCVCMCVY